MNKRTDDQKMFSNKMNYDPQISHSPSAVSQPSAPLALLTSVKVVLLGDDLAPVLGALGRQLLGLVQAADGQGLDVLLEGLLIHIAQHSLHGAQEGLHPALQVVWCLLRLDDEAEALHAIGPTRPAEHDVTFSGKEWR